MFHQSCELFLHKNNSYDFSKIITHSLGLATRSDDEKGLYSDINVHPTSRLVLRINVTKMIFCQGPMENQTHGIGTNHHYTKLL